MKPFASSARCLVAVLIIIQVRNYTCLVIIRQVEISGKREWRAGNQVMGDLKERYSFRGTTEERIGVGMKFLIPDEGNNR
jgi:hypothetical protein